MAHYWSPKQSGRSLNCVLTTKVIPHQMCEKQFTSELFCLILTHFSSILSALIYPIFSFSKTAEIVWHVVTPSVNVSWWPSWIDIKCCSGRWCELDDHEAQIGHLHKISLHWDNDRGTRSWMLWYNQTNSFYISQNKVHTMHGLLLQHLRFWVRRKNVIS